MALHGRNTDVGSGKRWQFVLLIAAASPTVTCLAQKLQLKGHARERANDDQNKESTYLIDAYHSKKHISMPQFLFSSKW